MYYCKRLIVLLMVLALIGGVGGIAKADPTDEATLGGQNSSRLYRWRVDSDGDFIPGADGDNDIGDSTHEVNNIYAEEVTNSGHSLFQTTLYASGHASGSTTIASIVSPLTSANIAFGLVRFANGGPGAHRLPDGVTGKCVTFELIADPNYTIIDDAPGDMTKTGWESIVFDTARDRITLLWVDDTYGWIITANDGCSITY